MRFNTKVNISNFFDRVHDFHAAFNVEERATFGPVRPEIGALRYKLLEEENAEYLEAIASQDEVAIADALTDMMYILIGTMCIHGFDNLAYEMFKEVHRSNMSKLDENGKPVYRADGKVMKSARYEPPRIRRVIIENELNKESNEL